jgi:hypothetical protein
MLIPSLTVPCWNSDFKRGIYKATAIPVQAWTGPLGPAGLRLTDFKTIGKVVRPTHRPPLPPGNIPGTHFCQRLSRPQGYSAAGKIMPMITDTIGKRTRDLPFCSAVPKPTALPRAPFLNVSTLTRNELWIGCQYNRYRKFIIFHFSL